MSQVPNQPRPAAPAPAPAAAAPRPAPDAGLQGLTTLLQLERSARHAGSRTELGFIIVNETHRLLDYHQAVLWRYNVTGGVRIEAVSGVAQLDRNAPYLVWLEGVVRTIVRSDGGRKVRTVTAGELGAGDQDGWQEWVPGHALWAPLVSPRGELIGGIWFTRAREWGAPESTLVDRLADAFAHAWVALEALDRRPFRERFAAWLPNRKIQIAVLLGVIAALLIPVHESVLVPADVVANQPLIVAAPVDGVVKQFHVRPNAAVKQGDLLFSLDDTTFRGRYEVATKALAVARADYLRAAQKGFDDDKSRAEVALLAATMQEKQAEADYTARLLERVDVRAPRDGVAVYGDANDWIGKPVATGERVMTLAEPTRTEVQAWVPVRDAINLEQGAPVKLFLNNDPTRPLDATLYQTSYEAQATPDGVLAFRVKARFDDGVGRPRIGLKGTAKVYGHRVTFFYYMMRRPLAVARQFLGL